MVRTEEEERFEKPTRHRVFVLVDEIFVEVFLNQFFGLFRKVRINK